MKKHYQTKRIFFFLIMLFFFLFGGYKLFFYFDHQSEISEQLKNREVTRLTKDELSLIKEGDFILRRGFGFFSDYVSKNLNDGPVIDVTHAGIITKQNDTLFVIHSLSSDVSAIDGVQKQTLSDFLLYSAPHKIIVTRLKNADSICCKNIAERANYYLERKIPFDHHGNYDDDKELYCTEMIWQILETDLKVVHLPTDTDARKKLFYSMMPMYNTKYFDIIINQYQDTQ
ncbi:hypothetical protein E0W68_10535 [Flavobacterium salilacus subsp. salilacus]|uniref:YiiX/YebB-like N1pC/P60 family cysteine hydrolase n=1 Tax=Flavobacterium TaxID=237 RepID=UPI0010756C24|nr:MULTISPECIES: YiiX/YebB-like N1pC/P60 family cysteine hydrolase [Flavobacterium]KAF2518165.1 hypothetical protein E0W68_10535 [Flavobacterium salilacus subsp. salilacus]MBE1615524.1 hypothetical protein [Flavobacterium sp. SaA2.13]